MSEEDEQAASELLSGDESECSEVDISVTKEQTLEEVRSLAPHIKAACESQEYFEEEFSNALSVIAHSYDVLEESSFEEQKQLKSEISDVLVELEIPEDLASIFSNLIDSYLPTDFHDGDDIDEGLMQNVDNLMSILMSSTEHSDSFCVAVVENDCLLKSMAAVLNHFSEDYCNETTEPKLEQLVKSCIFVGYDFFLHDEWDFVDVMHESGMVDAVKPYLTTSLKTLAIFFTIYIADEEEAEEFCSDDDTLTFVLETLVEAMNDDTKRSNGYSLWELLRVTEKLSTLDVNKKKLMEVGAFERLKPLIENGTEEEIEAVIEIFCQLAFEEDNAEEMREAGIAALVRPLEKSVESQSLKESISGFLWTLNQGEDERLSFKDIGSKALQAMKVINTVKSLQKESEKKKPAVIMPMPATKCEKHIMISYQHDSSEKVLQIKSMIVAHKHKVWIDKDNMGLKMVDSMVLAIDHASVVLICMSRKYKKSQWCSREARYALDNDKPVILLKMGKYKPDGWLQFLFGDLQYIDFSGKYSFESKMDQLLRAIKDFSD